MKIHSSKGSRLLLLKEIEAVAVFIKGNNMIQNSKSYLEI